MKPTPEPVKSGPEQAQDAESEALCPNRSLFDRSALGWAVAYFTVLVWSGWHPKDQFTWFLEVAPALAVLVVLGTTRRRFPLTPLLYSLILVHCMILMVGGKYTYAEVPLFDWAKEWFGWPRNNYDKVGHFAQGFVPAIAAREIFIRHRAVRAGSWLNFVVLCVCLAISAFYEFVEWWVAVATGGAADAFLGTQGYVWDTQSDMLMALIGAAAALLSLSRIHDRQIQSLSPGASRRFEFGSGGPNAMPGS